MQGTKLHIVNHAIDFQDGTRRQECYSSRPGWPTKLIFWKFLLLRKWLKGEVLLALPCTSLLLWSWNVFFFFLTFWFLFLIKPLFFMPFEGFLWNLLKTHFQPTPHLSLIDNNTILPSSFFNIKSSMDSSTPVKCYNYPFYSINYLINLGYIWMNGLFWSISFYMKNTLLLQPHATFKSLIKINVEITAILFH